MDHNGLVRLGLGDLEARVLLAVLVEEELTQGAIAALTGASSPSVSVAVTKLFKRGLVERVPGRRPSIVFLDPNAPAVLRRLVKEVEEDQRRGWDSVHEALEVVAAAAERREERRGPFHERQPRPRGLSSTGEWPGHRGRIAHDQVLTLSLAMMGTASKAKTHCPSRLIVTDLSADLELLASREEPGSEVRATGRPLPPLWILDRERVGIITSSREGQVLGWSQDQAHVRAASELFTLWWDEAGPGVVKPPREFSTCEAHLDVEQ
jgi:DNA-binding MarR family transcriptional regulator